MINRLVTLFSSEVAIYGYSVPRVTDLQAQKYVMSQLTFFFVDFEFKDQSFSFNYYEDNTLLKYFTFNLSEDYPGK